MSEDEVLRSERIGRLSDKQNMRDGGKMDEYSSAIQKKRKIIVLGEKKDSRVE